MNHIAETPSADSRDSWKSRMVAKIKECRDAVKNMMSFDVSYVCRTPTKTDSCDLKATSSDIVAFSSLALKHNQHNEPILTRNSFGETNDANSFDTVDTATRKTWNYGTLEFEHLNKPAEKSYSKFCEDFRMNNRTSSPTKNPVHTRL